MYLTEIEIFPSSTVGTFFSLVFSKREKYFLLEIKTSKCYISRNRCNSKWLDIFRSRKECSSSSSLHLIIHETENCIFNLSCCCTGLEKKSTRGCPKSGKWQGTCGSFVLLAGNQNPKSNSSWSLILTAPRASDLIKLFPEMISVKKRGEKT